MLPAELAYTYEQAGKKQEAANLYSQVAKSSKDNLGLQLSAAQALFNLGEVDAAQCLSGKGATTERKQLSPARNQGADGFVGEPTSRTR